MVLNVAALRRMPILILIQRLNLLFSYDGLISVFVNENDRRPHRSFFILLLFPQFFFGILNFFSNR